MSVAIVRGSHGPLCPYDGAWQNDAHRLHVQIQNAQYEAFAPFRDDDGELPEDLDAAVGEADRKVGGGMRLYVLHDGGIPTIGGQVTVRGAYWQCPVCGFVLPASEVEQR